MTRGARWATGVGALAAALFAGRWVASFLAARWWTAAVAPAALPSVTAGLLQAALLESAGIVLASAWFAGNLLVVARAIGSVQYPRRVGDIEIRESVPGRSVTLAALGIGLVVGVVVGTGAADQLPALRLAWHGLQYGWADPVLGHDAGLYAAQLPAWLFLQGFVRRLLVSGIAIVAIAYAALGALRVGSGGVALSGHARRHLGGLGAAIFLAGAVRLALHPMLVVAGIDGGGRLPGAFEIGLNAVPTAALAGAAVLLGLWALRGHPSRLVGAVIAAALALILRAALPAIGAPAIGPDARGRPSLMAWGLGAMLRHELDRPPPVPGPPADPGLWSPEAILPAADRLGPFGGAGRAVLELPAGRTPVWLMLHEVADSVRVTAVADAGASASGGVVSFRPADPLAYPGFTAYATLGPSAVRGSAPDHVTGLGPGVRLGGFFRRLALAWAVQTGDVLPRSFPDSDAVAWRLDPIARLAALVPDAIWTDPDPVFVDGRLTWLCAGTVPLTAFPLSRRETWRGVDLAGGDPGFLGVIDAVSGRTTVYLRPGAGPAARAVADLSGGFIAPAESLPPVTAEAVTYPPSWLAVQARALADGPFSLPQAGPIPGDSADLPRPIVHRDSLGAPVPTVAFVDPEPPGPVAALVEGTVRDARLTPVVIRIGSAASVAGPGRLDRQWGRFTGFERLSDSLQQVGDRLIAGPVQYLVTGGRLIAVRRQYRAGSRGTLAVAWVEVAAGDRLGAGPDLGAAWANLQGRLPPPSPHTAPDRMAEVRRWVARADSALRRGDLTTFGRAFEALKQLVNGP